MIKKLLILLTALVFSITAYAQNSKTLIAYFSWGGNTRTAANAIQRLTGADIFEITVRNPYPRDYRQCVDQAREERRNDTLPELNGRPANLASYDTVILAYPNWWGTYPQAVKKFLMDNDISDKRIAPICSHGGSRLGRSVNDLRALYPNANILEGLAIRGSGSESDLRNWLNRIGISVL